MAIQSSLFSYSQKNDKRNLHQKELTMKLKTNIYNTDDTPIVADLYLVKSSLTIEQVSRGEHESLWNQLVQAYHYLGHQKIIRPRMKYLIWLDDRHVSAISFNQAAYKMAARDRFMDWKDEKRQEQFIPYSYSDSCLPVGWETLFLNVVIKFNSKKLVQLLAQPNTFYTYRVI